MSLMKVEARDGYVIRLYLLPWTPFRHARGMRVTIDVVTATVSFSMHVWNFWSYMGRPCLQ